MDIDINYTEKGTGFPLILLHGNGGSNAEFESQIDYFSNRYRVIAPDTRGHGMTPKGEKPMSIYQFADDLFDFMKTLGIEKAHILGFSDGGNIALIFALKHPEMTEKLILNGANLFPHGMVDSLYDEIEQGYLASGKKDELLSLMINEPNISPDQLRSINIRTLVLVGENDLIKREHSELIARSLPNSTLKIIMGGDHFIVMTMSDEYNAAVEEFLD